MRPFLPALAALALLAAPPAAVMAQDMTPHSRDVKTNLLDHSNSLLISEDDAKRVLTDNIPARVWRIHNPGRYVFVSQVEGGVNPQRMCVVTARVMVLPLTVTLDVPMWRPLRKLTATSYDARPDSSSEQCREVAREKLKEATLAIVSNIVKI